MPSEPIIAKPTQSMTTAAITAGISRLAFPGAAGSPLIAGEANFVARRPVTFVTLVADSSCIRGSTSHRESAGRTARCRGVGDLDRDLELMGARDGGVSAVTRPTCCLLTTLSSISPSGLHATNMDAFAETSAGRSVGEWSDRKVPQPLHMNS